MNRLYRLCLRSSLSFARLRNSTNIMHILMLLPVYSQRTVLHNLDIKLFTNGEAAVQAFDTGEDLDANILGDMFREALQKTLIDYWQTCRASSLH